jgi:hypothetical protein
MEKKAPGVIRTSGAAILKKLMSTMRAKFRVTKVETRRTDQQITMMAVTSKLPFLDPFYPSTTKQIEQGNSEDNSFSKWAPSGELKMTITNPNLVGALKEGASFYLDFSEASD